MKQYTSFSVPSRTKRDSSLTGTSNNYAVWNNTIIKPLLENGKPSDSKEFNGPKNGCLFPVVEWKDFLFCGGPNGLWKTKLPRKTWKTVTNKINVHDILSFDNYISIIVNTSSQNNTSSKNYTAYLANPKRGNDVWKDNAKSEFEQFPRPVLEATKWSNGLAFLSQTANSETLELTVVLSEGKVATQVLTVVAYSNPKLRAGGKGLILSTGINDTHYWFEETKQGRDPFEVRPFRSEFLTGCREFAQWNDSIVRLNERGGLDLLELSTNKTQCDWFTPPSPKDLRLRTYLSRNSAGAAIELLILESTTQVHCWAVNEASTSQAKPSPDVDVPITELEVSVEGEKFFIPLAVLEAIPESDLAKNYRESPAEQLEVIAEKEVFRLLLACLNNPSFDPKKKDHPKLLELAKRLKIGRLVKQFSEEKVSTSAASKSTKGAAAPVGDPSKRPKSILVITNDLPEVLLKPVIEWLTSHSPEGSQVHCFPTLEKWISTGKPSANIGLWIRDDSTRAEFECYGNAVPVISPSTSQNVVYIRFLSLKSEERDFLIWHGSKPQDGPPSGLRVDKSSQQNLSFYPAIAVSQGKLFAPASTGYLEILEELLKNC